MSDELAGSLLKVLEHRKRNEMPVFIQSFVRMKTKRQKFRETLEKIKRIQNAIRIALLSKRLQRNLSQKNEEKMRRHSELLEALIKDWESIENGKTM